jgi:hypothetical protein
LAIHYNSKISTDGLVLCLDAANSKSYPGSGTTWTDLSGNGNTGTLVNGVGYNSDNGGSLSFDGVDDVVTTTSEFTTLEMWIYDTRSSGQKDILVYNWNGTLGTNSYTFNGTTSFRTDRNGAVGRNFSGVGQPPPNQWYRFCYIRNGDLYINETKYTGSGFDQDYTTMAFGATRSDIGSRLNGRISNIRMYNRALTAQEIQQNYNALKSRYI